MVNNINSKCRGNNIIFKLDMAKAYDKVSWIFLINVLRRFGFSEVFIDIIWRLISNNYYSININGNCHGFFKSTRGVKQGDPLSPALFIIMAEVLSRGLNQLMENKKSIPYHQPSGTQYISHLSFADDIIVFSNGNKKSVRAIMEFMQDYQEQSGQMLNIRKCTFYTGKDTNKEKIKWVKEQTGFRKQELPFKYLGCPIFKGRNKVSYYHELINNIRSKVEGWQTRLLNQADKIILIKHVLQSMPIYMCAVLNPPKTVIKEIDKIMAGCFWNDRDNKKYQWVGWNKCCKPTNEEGLGFKNMEEIIKVQSYKLWWKIRNNNSLWTKFINIKYRRNIDNNNSDSRGNKYSVIWRRISKIKEEAETYIEDINGSLQWKLGRNNIFTAKETWNHIRCKGRDNSDFKYIWCKFLPKKVSVFMWKVLHGKIAVDENVKSIGISMVSKCRCCKDNASENINHLLYRGEIAKIVWGYFTGCIGLKNQNNNLLAHLRFWWIRSRINGKNAIIFHVLPAVICWEIWKARNQHIYEEILMDHKSIIRKISETIKQIVRAYETHLSRGSRSESLQRIIGS